MVKYRVKFSGIWFFLPVLCVCICMLGACSTTNNKPLLIGFSADSSSIVVSHIDRPGLLQLNTVDAQDSALSSLITVLQTPSETDTLFREAPMEGQLILTDTNIVFKPSQPFVKGRDYLVITYLNARFGTAEQIFKSKLNTSVKPQQVVLTR